MIKCIKKMCYEKKIIIKLQELDIKFQFLEKGFDQTYE